MPEKRILVTGGAGFIGSHLCERLLSGGADVLCADNFYSGSRHSVSRLLSNSRFELLRHDVTLPLYVEVDEIYHLACPASPVHYQKNPISTMKTCIYGAVNMLDLAVRTGAKILFSSTSEIYGDPKEHPQTENYWGNVNPAGIRSCYDEGKRASECLFFDYHRQYRVSVKVARIFNTYGPLMHPNDGRVVSNFIVQALENKDITVYGDGLQTRSFCYVDDLVSGLTALMNDTETDFTGPVNLGNPAEFTIIELAKKIIDMTGSSSKIVFKALPQDDPCRRKPDISLAKTVLHWMPRVALDTGLQKTIQYFSERSYI
ncbi:MAG: SDR family oxidoreductase [Spirochaetaceae bacterium]|jgi:UDP-glucuronate decarboxylase|nr:SDR family oxidoreductase [Spirochaetaceae bacterium]